MITVYTELQYCTDEDRRIIELIANIDVSSMYIPFQFYFCIPHYVKTKSDNQANISFPSLNAQAILLNLQV